MHDLPVIGGLVLHLLSQLCIIVKYENKTFTKMYWMWL